MTTATEINGKIVYTKPKITDEGLLHLKALTVLQTLDLTNTKVTDAGLIHLKGRLGTLEVLGYRVSAHMGSRFVLSFVERGSSNRVASRPAVMPAEC